MLPFRLLDPQVVEPSFKGKCALAVMAKVPRAGRVKTRLSPPLSPDQSAALNIAFLRDTLECLARVSAVAPSVPVVSYTPPGEESGFIGIVPEGTTLIAQTDGDFGERLYGTLQALISVGFSAVCLIDSDSPTVPASAYETAVSTLLNASGPCAVLGSSADGGYYALGTNCDEPHLFHAIHWSTSSVAAQTRQRAVEAHLPLHELPEWYDVDDRHSLKRLHHELFEASSSSQKQPPHTTHALSLILESLPTGWQEADEPQDAA